MDEGVCWDSCVSWNGIYCELEELRVCPRRRRCLGGSLCVAPSGWQRHNAHYDLGAFVWLQYRAVEGG